MACKAPNRNGIARAEDILSDVASKRLTGLDALLIKQNTKEGHLRKAQMTQIRRLGEPDRFAKCVEAFARLASVAED